MTPSPYISLVGGQNPPIGKHWLIRIGNILRSKLETLAIVRKQLWDIAQFCQLNVVGESGHQFQPVGVTYLLLLAESHLSIHTYPERNEAYLDLFTCQTDFKEETLLLALQQVFQDAEIERFLILR